MMRSHERAKAVQGRRGGIRWSGGVRSGALPAALTWCSKVPRPPVAMLIIVFVVVKPCRGEICRGWAVLEPGVSSSLAQIRRVMSCQAPQMRTGKPNVTWWRSRKGNRALGLQIDQRPPAQRERLNQKFQRD